MCMVARYVKTNSEFHSEFPQSVKNNQLLECKLLFCVHTDQNLVFVMVGLVTQ